VVPDPEHILHVEDSDEDAALIAHLLAGHADRIGRARTYGEMIEYPHMPDVVLLDLRIPGSNNPLRLVSDAVRRFRTAGIVLLTGIADREGEELSVRAMAAGAQVRLVKGLFDKRRLWLSIREAYQQRQHMIRAIEESRADMRVDPKALQDSLRTVIDRDLYKQIQSIEGGIQSLQDAVLHKLKKLGAEDTQPHEIVLGENVTAEAVHWLISWTRRHRTLAWAIVKAGGWIIAAVGALYLGVSDYIRGIHETIYDTHERVRKIEDRLDKERPDETR